MKRHLIPVLRDLADEFHRRERSAHDDGVIEAREHGQNWEARCFESANASARQLVLDSIAALEEGPEMTTGRECYEIAQELAHRIQPFVDDADARRVLPTVEGWCRALVGTIIEEREEAVSDLFEFSEGTRREKAARWLRKLARLVEYNRS